MTLWTRDGDLYGAQQGEHGGRPAVPDATASRGKVLPSMTAWRSAGRALCR